MYVKRKLESKMIEFSSSFPAVLLVGARQVGKTTMLKHLSETYRKFVTLDDYFGAYFQTYLSRDIKDLAQVGDELAFYRFMRICGSLAATSIDYTNIAKKVSITVNKVNQ